MGNFKIILPDTIVRDFETDYGLNINAVTGMGMPQMAIVSDEYAISDGENYQRSMARGRYITLTGNMKGTTLADLQAKRATLIAAINRDFLNGVPFTLRYVIGSATYDLAVHYAGGMEWTGDANLGFNERIALRLYAPDPFWKRADNPQTVSPSVRAALGSSYITRRAASGAWDAMLGANAPAAAINAVVVDSAGAIWVAAGSAVHRLVGSTWTQWTANGTVRALAVGANGTTIYAGGDFTTLNAVAINDIAVWSGSAWASYGAGFLSTGSPAITTRNVYSIRVFGTRVFACGAIPYLVQLSNAGAAWATWAGVPAAATGIAYDVGWSAAIAVTTEHIVLGGAFTAGTVTNLGVFSLVGGIVINNAASSTVRKVLKYGGDYVLAGDFTTITTVSNGTVTVNRVAKLNIVNASGTYNVQVSAYSAGFSATINSIEADAAGTLIVGSNDAALRLAKWSGSTWEPYADYTTATNVNAATPSTVHGLVVGLAASVAISGPVTTTITNPGNAIAYPVLVLTRTAGGSSATLRSISDSRGNLAQWAYAMSLGEVITIDLAPGKKTARNQSGVSIPSLPLSRLGLIGLPPGANPFTIFVDGDAPITATLTYLPRVWSAEG